MSEKDAFTWSDPLPLARATMQTQPLVPQRPWPLNLLTQTQGGLVSQSIPDFLHLNKQSHVCYRWRTRELTVLFYSIHFWLWLRDNPEVIHGCDLLGFKRWSWASIWGQSRGLHVHVFRMKLKKPTKEADMLGFFCYWGKDWSFC